MVSLVKAEKKSEISQINRRIKEILEIGKIVENPIFQDINQKMQRVNLFGNGFSFYSLKQLKEFGYALWKLTYIAPPLKKWVLIVEKKIKTISLETIEIIQAPAQTIEIQTIEIIQAPEIIQVPAQAEKIVCFCGGNYTKPNKLKHFSSKKHKAAEVGQITEKGNFEVACECGVKYGNYHKKKHLESIGHKKFEELKLATTAREKAEALAKTVKPVSNLPCDVVDAYNKQEEEIRKIEVQEKVAELQKEMCEYKIICEEQYKAMSPEKKLKNRLDPDFNYFSMIDRVNGKIDHSRADMWLKLYSGVWMNNAQILAAKQEKRNNELEQQQKQAAEQYEKNLAETKERLGAKRWKQLEKEEAEELELLEPPEEPLERVQVIHFQPQYAEPKQPKYRPEYYLSDFYLEKQKNKAALRHQK